jgi:hypothetical protein
MGRTFIVGDVHGCSRELEQLLERVRFESGDRLVFVGDVVARGPDSLGVLDIIRRTGALLVRGNHEDKLLASLDPETHPLVWKHDGGSKPKPHRKPLGRFHANVAEQLRPIDWALLEASPLHVDLPEHDVRVVHAGVVPGVPIDDQERSTLLTIRALGPHGEPLEKRGGVLWGERYRESPHVVFGHNARSEPQLHPHATGIDTGCVYGGYLTALRLEDGQKVPVDTGARRKLLVQVPASKAYYATD